jgi:hypothetical protein
MATVPADDRLVPGTSVEVLVRFHGSWTAGFEVAAAIRNGRYRLRRRSDGVVLPTTFPRDDLRPTRSPR